MRILVTGSSGFVGEHLCGELTTAGHQVIGLDVSPRRFRSSEWDLHGYSGYDLLWPKTAEQVIARAKPDVVVHLAAKVGRLFGEDDLARTVEDNVTMTAHVARACDEAGVKLVYASTSEIYGDNGNELCDEVDGPFTLPHNLYGLTKGFGEQVCELYAPNNLTVWRISMPFGPGLPAGRGRAAIVNFLHQAHHRQPIPVHKGSERAWCWIGDTVRAMRMTLELTQGGTFNIGRDDNATSMVDVARLACDITDAPYSLIEEIDAPARQTVVKRLATDRIRALGWEPHVSLEEGMRRTYEAMSLEPVAQAA